MDCEWTEWEEWSPCSKSCGDGIRERQRNISVEALNGGDSCQGAAAAFEECNDGLCPADPKGNVSSQPEAKAKPMHSLPAPSPQQIACH